MKKLIGRLLMVAAVICVLCLTASATDQASGMKNLQAETGYTLTPQLADQTAATLDGGVYVNAERVQLTFKGTANTYYFIYMVDDDSSVPTTTNVVYVNQVSAADGNITLNLYPSKLENGKTYTIYVSGDGKQAKAGSFEYYVPYVLGDVNNDGYINAQDATQILRYAAKLRTFTATELLAADVNQDGLVNAQDATQILRYAAKLPSSLDD